MKWEIWIGYKRGIHFISKEGSSIIDYTLASEGVLKTHCRLKIGVQVISTA
jgi:hypothetical protein